MKQPFRIVAAMFLVSGATGLLYEVAFAKVLATIFGATAYAISTVLAAFMGGLALGSYVGGRVAHRVKRPVLAYGVAEMLVGAMCALTPYAFDALGSAYVAIARGSDSFVALTAARAALTFLVILVPTTCMGATLPLLSRAFALGAGGERRLPALYAINTLGGATGSMLSAYAILPVLGVRGTMHAAAALNVGLGVAALMIGRAAVATESTEDRLENADEAPGAPPLPPTLLVLAFVSGFLVFAAEVVDTHLLTLLIGNSAYAFGLMLAVFLLCLGLGAARASSFGRRHGAYSLTRGLALTALAAALTLPLWDQLPRFFAFAGKHVDSWAGREVCRALAAVVILAPPTYFMGTTFPLLLGKVARRASVARDIARLTIANTAGTIIGSVATGYVLLPALGSQRTLVAVVIGFNLLAMFAYAQVGASATSDDAARAKPGEGRFHLALGGLGFMIALFAPTWDLARLTNGVNVYFTHGPPPDAIEFVREDVHGGVTTVARRGELLTLYTNGKFQGDDGAEMIAQRRFAHYPGLFLAHERRALVIGLGTGTTLGAVVAYPFEHVDVAEISPSIVEAARRFYAGPSRGGLDDPRVRLQLNDGRNVLLVATEPYDLITIELTSVWFAGASNLYSHEFYELAKSRLASDGVLQQWVQLHHIRPRELAAIVRTVSQVFPHVALFEGGSQGILVASQAPLVASRARLERLDRLPAIAETLEGKPLSGLLSELILSDQDLERLCEEIAQGDGGPLVSTDDNLYLEYATPKGNVLEYHASLAATLALLDRFRTPDVQARHLGP